MTTPTIQLPKLPKCFPVLNQNECRIIPPGSLVAEPIKPRGDERWLVVLNSTVDVGSGKSHHVNRGWDGALYIRCESRGRNGKHFQDAYTYHCWTDETECDFLREPRGSHSDTSLNGHQPRDPETGRALDPHIDKGAQWYKRVVSSFIINGDFQSDGQVLFLSWESDPNSPQYEGPHGPITIRGGTFEITAGGHSKHQILAPGKVRIIGAELIGQLLVGESFAGGMMGADGNPVRPGLLVLRNIDNLELEVHPAAKPYVVIQNCVGPDGSVIT